MIGSLKTVRGRVLILFLPALFAISGCQSKPSKPADAAAPLLQAVKEGNIEQIKTLLDQGVDINIKSKEKITALHEAVGLPDEKKRHAVVEFLLERGADFQARDEFNLTPLHVAAIVNDPKMIERLITNGADADVGAKRRTVTPLHSAAFWGSKEAAETLIAHGATVNAVNEVDHTPLHIANDRDNAAVAQLLIAHGGKDK